MTANLSTAPEFQKTLMSLWLRNRDGTRPIGEIVTDARAGRLPGVEPMDSGFGFIVVDEAAALAAMKINEAPEARPFIALHFPSR